MLDLFIPNGSKARRVFTIAHQLRRVMVIDKPLMHISRILTAYIAYINNAQNGCIKAAAVLSHFLVIF